MGTDYSALASQSAGGVPGAAWGNSVRANQEALVHPPSSAWIGVGHYAPSTKGTEPDPITASTYVKVNFVSTPHGQGPLTGFGAQLTWQDDVESTTTAASPFVDSANNTYSGATLLEGADAMDTTNSFKVPANGIYLVSAMIGTTDNIGGSGDFRASMALNGSRIDTRHRQFEPSGASSTKIELTRLMNLTTSDFFHFEAFSTLTGTSIDRAWMYVVRLSESAD